MSLFYIPLKINYHTELIILNSVLHLDYGKDLNYISTTGKCVWFWVRIFANIMSALIHCKCTNLLVTLLSQWNCCIFFSFCLSSCEGKDNKETHQALVPDCSVKSSSGTRQNEHLSQFLALISISCIIFFLIWKCFSRLFSTLSFTVWYFCHCQETSEISSWSLLPFVNILYIMCALTSTNVSFFLELQAPGHFQSKMLHFKLGCLLIDNASLVSFMKKSGPNDGGNENSSMTAVPPKLYD